MTKVAVIVGRFQVPELTLGHKRLIETAFEESDKVLFFIGENHHLRGTKRNPLPMSCRSNMIRTFIDNNKGIFTHLDKSFTIAPIADHRHDDKWSDDLDHNIESYLGAHLTQEMDEVTLYGGRDNFLLNYSGKFNNHRLIESFDNEPSGTEVRQSIISPLNTTDFRTGVIYAHNRTHPVSYATVDVAIFNAKHDQILLIRKPGETRFQLCGGFADPSSESYEEDCIREVKEECGILVYSLRYLTSRKIDDWRYRREVDCIKTMLFMATTDETTATAGDDAEEVKWFPIANTAWDAINKEEIFEGHQALIEMACRYAYAMSVM